jgi:small subunit ribosomal protein S11
MPTLLPTEALPDSFRASQSDPVFAAPPPSRNVYGARREPHRLHVLSTRNNTIVTLTTSAGDVLARTSPGALGFRNAARSSYDAAYRVAIHMFERIEADRVGWQLARLEIIWNGFGQGREAVYRAILSAEGGQIRNLVTRMSDNTPIKVGGTRPKKRRML